MAAISSNFLELDAPPRFPLLANFRHLPVLWSDDQWLHFLH